MSSTDRAIAERCILFIKKIQYVGHKLSRQYVIFHFPEMALDLAFNVGWDFGEAFEGYLNDNKDASTSRKVSEYQVFLCV